MSTGRLGDDAETRTGLPSPALSTLPPAATTPARRRTLGRRFERAAKRRLTGLVVRVVRPRPATPPTARDVHHVLAIRQHNQMGDMVLTLPALRLLRQAYPSARLVFVTNPLCEELLAGHPEIDRLLVFRKQTLWRPWQLLPFLGALRRPRPDLAIVLGTVSFSTTSALLAWASGARCRAGVASHRFGSDLSRAIYHLELPVAPPEVHEVEHNAAPLRGLGIDGVAGIPELPVRNEAARAASEFVERSFPNSHGPVVVIHPGAGKQENIWPVERFAQVARVLASQADARIVVSEGPRDAVVAARLLADCPGAARWRANLGATLGLLRQAALFLGNDTGMAHVAAAVGTPTVAVFGPTDPGRWSPAGRWVRCVRSSTGRVEDARTEDVVAAAHAALRHATS